MKKKILLIILCFIVIILLAQDEIDIFEHNSSPETGLNGGSTAPDTDPPTEPDIHDSEDKLDSEADEIDSTPPPEIDLTGFTEVSPGFYLPKSPAKAALLSAFIPGAGQIYNERYIKSGLVIGAQVGLILRTVHHNERVNRFRHRKNDSVLYEVKYKEAYDDRQSFIFWIGTSVLLSAMDAYVDAHLINFKKLKEEIHLRFEEDKVIISFNF